MKRKKLFYRLTAALVCAALCVSSALLTGCGQKTPAFEAQPGVRYTQLMTDINRQVAVSFSNEINQVEWWGTADGHLLAYGSFVRPDDPESRRDNLLVEVDPDNNGYNCVQLTLPDVPEDLTALQAALADTEANLSAVRDAEEGYDLPVRRFVGSVTDSASTVYILVDDVLLHYQQTENDSLLVTAGERALTLCSLAADGAAQPMGRLQLPEDAASLPNIGETLFIDDADGLWLSATDYLGSGTYFLRYSLTDGSLTAQLELPAGLVVWDGCAGPITGDRLLAIAQPLNADGSFSTEPSSFYIADGISGDSPSWQAPLPLPSGLAQDTVSGLLLPLDGVGDEVLLRTARGVVAWQPDSGEATERALWTDFAVDVNNLRAAFALEEGRYLAICRQNDDLRTAYELRVLTPLDPAMLAGREILTFGMTTYGQTGPAAPTNAVAQIIADFNASNSEYYIQIVDYYRRNAEINGWMNGSGSALLLQDILDGSVPDILMTSDYGGHVVHHGMYLSGQEDYALELARQGLLLDLGPYLDADPELSREDFLPGVLNAYALGDTLPAITPAFSVYTCSGPAALVGDGSDWTLDRFLQLTAEHPGAWPLWHKANSTVLNAIVQFSPSLFIDRDNAQAHFDSPAFTQLLEASAAWPSEMTWDWAIYEDPSPDLSDGTALLLPEVYQEWRQLLGPRFVWGDDASFVGFPGGETASYQIIPELQLAISSRCKNPDAAWQLVRQFLLPDTQSLFGCDHVYHPGFPLRRDALLEAAASLTDLDEDHWDYYVHYSYFEQAAAGDYWRQGITQKQVDDFMTMLDSLHPAATLDDLVETILYEEIAYFYDGVRSAEETASIIQNRVQTYLSEQS